MIYALWELLSSHEITSQGCHPNGSERYVAYLCWFYARYRDWVTVVHRKKNANLVLSL